MLTLGRLARQVQGVQQVLRDPLRKPLTRMLGESLDVARRSRAVPAWYFLGFAYRRGTGPYADYIVPDQYERLKALWHSEHYAVLEDKLRFHERCSALGLAVPRLLAHNDREEFRLGPDSRMVHDRESFAGLIGELCRESASGSVFMKPVDGMQGTGCRRIDGTGVDLDAVYADAVAGRWLFQETVLQHAALGAIYPHSVNTLRIVTCRPPGRAAVILGTVLRLGGAGRVVDNASQGGLFVGVDLATGVLHPNGHRFFKHGGDVVRVHPDTGYRFEGTVLPSFDRVLALVEDAAVQIAHKLIGWDIAVTPMGPVLIEGNTVPDIVILEIAHGRGLMAHPALRELYAWVASRGRPTGPYRRPRLS